jgi:poly(beta-D-mannuronate) lyase
MAIRVNLRTWVGLLLLACGGDWLGAREFLVADRAALADALKVAATGDTVVLRSGTWTGVRLDINRGGSAGRPLVVRAEVPGAVMLNGDSRIAVNAPYVVVEGLLFSGGAIRKGAVIEFNSHYGIVREVAMVDYNPRSFDTRYYWVFFNGSDNLLERCYFKGKNHLEPLVGNALEGSLRNTVRGCFFQDIPYAEGNGREVIRVWGTGKFDAGAEGGSYFTIEGNLFDHADGEGVEIVSLKSNYNVVRGNTVVATRGGINIRQGSHNRIEGNVILGEGAKGAQGLRMSGRANTVTGNYISGCESGIRASAGEYVAAALTPSYRPNLKAEAKRSGNADGRIPTYPPVRDLTLAGNTVVNVTGPDLEIGFGYKRHWPQEQMVLLPENCVFNDNRFVRPRGGDSVVGPAPDPDPLLKAFRFEPNRFENNRVVGGRVTLATGDSGLRLEPLPAGWTEEQERRELRVLGPDDVGPAWLTALRHAGRKLGETVESTKGAAAPR